MKGILGRKIGMTQVFTTDGVLIPVTVVEATPNVVLQKKTVATDGYDLYFVHSNKNQYDNEAVKLTCSESYVADKALFNHGLHHCH